MQLFAHLSFNVAREGLRLDELTQLVFDGVIFDFKEILNELLQDFTESYFIDMSVGIEPSNLHPNVLEHPLPVGHVLKLVHYVSTCLLFSDCARRPKDSQYLLEVWNDISVQLVFAEGLLCIDFQVFLAFVEAILWE